MSNKITKTQLNELVKKSASIKEKTIITINDIDLKFDTYMSYADKYTFVENVVESCFDENMYKPTRLNLLFFIGIIDNLSNISIPTMKNKDGIVSTDTEIIYKLMYEYNILEFLLSENKLVKELKQLVDETIKIKIDNINNKSPFEDLVKTLEDSIKTLNNTFKDVDLKQATNVLSGVGELNEKTLIQMTKNQKEISENNANV